MSRADPRAFTDADSSTALDALDKAIDTIYEKKAINLSYEELYRHAYNLVLNKQGDLAYKNITTSLQRNFHKYIESLSKLQKNDEDTLQAFVAMWEDVRLMMKLTSNIFLYLDKNYVPKKNVAFVKILGYDLFKKMLLEENRDLYQRLLLKLFALIKKERDGNSVPRHLIRSSILVTVFRIILGFIIIMIGLKCNEFGFIILL